MPRTLPLLACSLLLTTGCENSNEITNSETPTPTPQATITVLDGYLKDAVVYAGEQCDTELGKTNNKGQLSVDASQISERLCATAFENLTVDMTRGIVKKTFDMEAYNSLIISPYTDYLSGAIEQGLSHDEAFDRLQANFGQITLDKETITGDYLTKSDDVAEAIIIVGEALADHDDQPLTVKDDIIAEITQAIGSDVNDENTDFDPTERPQVSVDDQGNVTVVVPGMNTAPTVNGSISDFQSFTGQPITPIDLTQAFADQQEPSSDLSYEINITSLQDLNGLSVNNGTLEGTASVAGMFTLEIKAVDSDNASSPPILVNWDVRDPNHVPVVDSVKAGYIQRLLNDHHFYTNEYVNERFYLMGFYTDADQDPIQYEAGAHTLTPGIKVSIQDDWLSIYGKTPDSGQQSITLYGTDGMDDGAPVTVTFNTQELPANPPPRIDRDEHKDINEWLIDSLIMVGVSENMSERARNLFYDDDLVSVVISDGNYADFGLTMNIDNTSDRNLTITGTPNRTGWLDFTLLATDANGGQSTANFITEVRNVGNRGVQMDFGVQHLIQSDMFERTIILGEPYLETIDLSGLFFDPDNDSITVSAFDTRHTGLSYHVDENHVLTISGTPDPTLPIDGNYIVLRANDNPNGTVDGQWRWTSTYILVPMLFASPEIEPTDNIPAADASALLDERIMYRTNHDTKNSCVALRFKNNEVQKHVDTQAVTCKDPLTDADFTAISHYHFDANDDSTIIKTYALGTTPTSDSDYDATYSIMHHDMAGGEMMIKYEPLGSWSSSISTELYYDTASEINARISNYTPNSYKSFVADPTNNQVVESTVTGEHLSDGYLQVTVEANTSYLNCGFFNAYRTTFKKGNRTTYPNPSCREEANKIIALFPTSLMGNGEIGDIYFRAEPVFNPNLTYDPARYKEPMTFKIRD